MTALSSAIFVTPFLDGARRFTRIRLKLDIRGGLRPNGLAL
ncbi:hypothetical protein ACO22_05882 [Paracoccidioides brasiliensis]|uniref:Uncharacterized protein n=1 Tax=Paracoccidioides brasiliensis TaxID=121759 RepID=A0A1D2J977_PARBR|nr:hypothetical protein ACO22_05882 [Paracoccidioides brasiliensis]